MTTRKIEPQSDDAPVSEAQFAEQVGDILAQLPKDEAISLALSLIVNNIAIAKQMSQMMEDTGDRTLQRQGRAARFHMVACMFGAFKETAQMLDPRHRAIKATLLRMVQEYEQDQGPLDLDTVKITIDYGADQSATDGSFEFPDGTMIQ